MSRRYQWVVAVILCLLLTTNISAAVNNEATYSVATNEIQNWPKGPDLYSDTAVLMDADSGQVIYDKGMNELRYPASITKVMTALLALENSQSDETVTFTATGIANIAEGTNIQMQVGETLTMEQCLAAVLIRSANEVADQVGEYVSGSKEAFVEKMNQRAAEIGCINTQFANASGLPNEQHWTTAYDMGLILREALKNEAFCEIIATLEYTIPATNLTPEPRVLSSHHALVVPTAPEYYEGVLGGKTGVTDESKNTLVTAVKRGDTTLIAVVLRAAPGEVCADSTALFDYGFEKFEKLNLKGSDLIVPKGTSESDLTNIDAKTETDAIYSYYYNDYLLGSVTVSLDDLQAEETGEAEPQNSGDLTKEQQEQLAAAEKKAQKEKNQEKVKDTYNVIIIALGAVIAFAVVMIIVRIIINRKRR